VLDSGVGKTTMMRSLCNLLSETEMKKVVIVDTVNNIGGDGDIPDDSIGDSRRMQADTPTK